MRLSLISPTVLVFVGMVTQFLFIVWPCLAEQEGGPGCPQGSIFAPVPRECLPAEDLIRRDRFLLKCIQPVSGKNYILNLDELTDGFALTTLFQNMPIEVGSIGKTQDALPTISPGLVAEKLEGLVHPKSGMLTSLVPGHIVRILLVNMKSGSEIKNLEIVEKKARILKQHELFGFTFEISKAARNKLASRAADSKIVFDPLPNQPEKCTRDAPITPPQSPFLDAITDAKQAEAFAYTYTEAETLGRSSVILDGKPQFFVSGELVSKEEYDSYSRRESGRISKESPRALTGPQLARLLSILSNLESYGAGGSPRRPPPPTVGFTLLGPGKEMLINLTFASSGIWMSSGERNFTSTMTLRAQQELLTLVYELLPEPSRSNLQKQEEQREREWAARTKNN